MSDITKNLQKRIAEIGYMEGGQKWRVTPGFAENLFCVCCLANKNRETEHVEELCDEVETLAVFCYLCVWLSANGGQEEAM